MPFTLEPDVELKASPASENSKKIYKSKLNALEKLGLAKDRAELKKNHKSVIAHIEGLYGNDEGGRQKKRQIVYAIFWAMDPAYLKKNNFYYRYLQKINPLKNVVTGEAWMPIKKYRELDA
jgi:hypothetical protein